MSARGLLLLGLLYFLVGGELRAQKSFKLEPAVLHYTNNDGLASNETYRSFQDHKGYLWFMTDHGVSKYDGYRFTSYSTNDGLCDNTVVNGVEDSKNRLWFYSFAGCISIIENDSVYAYKYNHLIHAPNGVMDYSIYVDDGDTLWYWMWSQPHLFWIAADGKDGVVENGTAQHINLLQPNGVAVTRKFVRGETYHDLVVTNEKKQSIHYQLPASIPANSGKAVRWSADELFTTSNKSILRIRTDSGVVQHTTLPANYEPIDVAKSPQNDFWVGTTSDHGVLIYPEGNLDVTPYHVLGGGRKPGFCFDSLGGAWINSSLSGIYHWPDQSIWNFSIEDKVVALSSVGDRVLVGGRTSGIYVLEDSGQHTLQVKKHWNEDKEVYFIKTDKERHIYAAVAGPDLPMLVLGKEKHPVHHLEGISLGFSARGGAWMGSRYGLHYFEEGKEVARYYEMFKQRVVSVLEDQTGKVWLGTLHGVWKFNGTEFSSMADQNPAFAYRVDHMVEEEQGGIWMATRGQGLLFHHQNEVIKFTTEDGLSSNFCQYLLKQQDTLWVGTNRGINCLVIDPESHRLKSIDKITMRNGLPSNSVNAFMLRNGDLWIGTDQGISVVDLQTWQGSCLEKAPFGIEKVLVNGRGLAEHRLSALNAEQNNLTIHFKSLAFNAAEVPTYRFRLVGNQQDWVVTEATEVSFTALDPQPYIFEVELLENGKPVRAVKLPFNIEPAVWQTLWFQLLIQVLVGVLLIGVTVLIYRQRMKKQKNLQQLKNQVVVNELKALRAQMNPHFIFNALNSIQKYILSNEPDEAYEYLGKFSVLMRKILVHSRKGAVALDEELGLLKDYLELEQLRVEYPIELEIDIAPELNLIQTLIPPLLLQPLLENAIWHGLQPAERPGKIRLQVNEASFDQLEIVIEDNGVGRRRAEALSSVYRKKGTSTGLGNTKSRVTLLGYLEDMDAAFDVEDVLGANGNIAGTRIKIQLPKGWSDKTHVLLTETTETT